MGLRFPNRLGLAAGYDKDGEAWRGLARLGLGHIELGTVTPRSQPGNPKPRVFRLTEDRSLINRLGFPSRGAEHLAARLAGRAAGGAVIGVNIGKQRDTPVERAAEDYAALAERFAPLADYLAVNVSSPNTPDLRRLQQGRALEALLHEVVRARDAAAALHGRRAPVLVKLAPDLDERELEAALAAIEAAGIDGVIATNTTIARQGLRSPRASEPGGLSGAALGPRSTAVVAAIRRRAGDRLPLVACGGVMSADDARIKLDAGASLVQVYTGLVYEGPGLVGRILRAL
jgi:dihydroorotate dehydrogenase